MNGDSIKIIGILLAAILPMTVFFFGVLHTGILTNSELIRDHEKLPEHAVASEKFNNMEKKVDEILKELRNGG